MVLFYCKFSKVLVSLFWILKWVDDGSSFVFGKASFIIKEAPPWDALVTWMVIRESCVQAGTKLNPQSKSPLCSERRLIPKGACHVLMSPLLTLLRAGMISWGIMIGSCSAILQQSIEKCPPWEQSVPKRFSAWCWGNSCTIFITSFIYKFCLKAFLCFPVLFLYFFS